MSTFFGVLLFLSVSTLVVGLIKPKWASLESRMRVITIFGSATLIFLVLVAVTSDNQPNVATAPSTPQNQLPAKTVIPMASNSSPTTTPLTAAQNMQAADGLYISTFNQQLLPDYGVIGSDIKTAGNDIDTYNFSAAITDLQTVQSDLQATQLDLKRDFQLYQPLSPKVMRINTLANDSLTNGLKGSNIAISDIENGDYKAVNTVALPYLQTMLNEALEAKALVAGWKAQNPGW